MSKKFNHLNIPSHWQSYWTRFPEGHTILEALIQWVSQVDEMVDNQNKLSDTVSNYGTRLDQFIDQFEGNLSDEVKETLGEWQASGFLDVVISEALQWQLDDYITTNEQDKNELTTQLAQTELDLLYRGVNIKQFTQGDGVSDDTQNLENALLMGKTYVFDDSSYLTEKLHFPDNSIIYFNGTKLFKKPINGAFIKTGKNSVIYGDLTINGNKTGEGGRNEVGIIIEEGSRVFSKIKSINNDGHGIRLEDNTYATFLESYDNGNNHGSAGTGDGVYMSNSNNVEINRIITKNNSRIGTTVTTYDVTTEYENPELSKDIRIGHITSNDNAYIDTNIEAASFVDIDLIDGFGTVGASKSNDCTFKKLRTRTFYAPNHDNIKVTNAELHPRDNPPSSVFQITGDNIVIENIFVKKTALAYPVGQYVLFVNCFNNNGVYRNIRVEGGDYGINLLGINILENVVSVDAETRPIRFDSRSFGSLADNSTIRFYAGICTFYYQQNPNGILTTFKQNDKAINSNPEVGTYLEWVFLGDTWKGIHLIES